MASEHKVKLPEPDFTLDGGETPCYYQSTLLAMHEQGRLAGLEAAAEACDDVEEPRYYGYENPNTFSEGKAACMVQRRLPFVLQATRPTARRLC
jgi:hypothetical protein